MIWIPKLIDDYNHKMGGVHLVDQYIAYYQPNVPYQRNWILLFVQIMDIIHNYLYMVHKACFDRMGMSRRQIHLFSTHKMFAIGMVQYILLLSTFREIYVDDPTNANFRERDYSDNTSAFASSLQSIIPTFLNLDQTST